jgi:hypothetical protein
LIKLGQVMATPNYDDELAEEAVEEWRSYCVL